MTKKLYFEYSSSNSLKIVVIFLSLNMRRRAESGSRLLVIQSALRILVNILLRTFCSVILSSFIASEKVNGWSLWISQSLLYAVKSHFGISFVMQSLSFTHTNNRYIYIVLHITTQNTHTNSMCIGGKTMIRIDVVLDIETTGLNPLQDRIIAIGLKTKKCEAIFIENDESVMLDNFWNHLRQFDYFRLIGFNVPFDARFLILRSLLHRIKVIDIWGKLVDLRWILLHDKYAKGTLNDFGVFLGIGTKYNGFEGAHAQILWQQGKASELLNYLSRDLMMTFKIFVRCEEIGLF